MRLAGKRLSGTDRRKKRVSAAPEATGKSGQLGFAVESYRGTTNKQRRGVIQHAKGCKIVPFRSLNGGADEGARIRNERFVHGEHQLGASGQLGWLVG